MINIVSEFFSITIIIHYVSYRILCSESIQYDLYYSQEGVAVLLKLIKTAKIGQNATSRVLILWEISLLSATIILDNLILGYY